MTNELVEQFEKHVQAQGFLRLGSENKRLLAQFAEWLEQRRAVEPEGDPMTEVSESLKPGDRICRPGLRAHPEWDYIVGADGVTLDRVTKREARQVEPPAERTRWPGWSEGKPEPTASHIDAFLAMALPRIADLMQADPEDATPEGRELMLLADLADRYERQKYPEFSGRPVKPHRSGGGGPPAPEPPIEVLPRHPNRTPDP